MSTSPYQVLSAVRKNEYRDFDMAFRRNPITNDIMVKDTEGSITQAIKNLVLTSLYESPKEVGRGTNVNASLFELYSWELEFILRRAIARAIISGEPRVSLKNVIAGEDQDGTIRVKIEYLITGQIGVRTIDIAFNRAR